MMAAARDLVCCMLLAAGAVLVVLGHAAPALAQVMLPSSRAFAAAETASHLRHACVRDTVAQARECALAKCRASGQRDCHIVASCERAQWSGSLSISLKGARTALVACGMPSRPGLIARLKDVCRTYRSRGLDGCTLDLVWTPNGEEEYAGLHWSRQSLGWGRSVAR